MSQAHKGSYLPQKNGVTRLDSETVFFLKTNTSLKDVIRGEEPCYKQIHYDASSPSKEYIDTDVSFADNGTIEMWIYPTLFYDHNTIFECPLNGNRWESWINVDGRIFFRRLETGGSINTPPLTSINSWYHLAITWEGNGLSKIYINGELKAEGNLAGAPHSNLRIGGLINTASRNCYSDIRVWNHARAQQDIDENKFSLRSENREGLVAYWRLDDNDGNAVIDSSGNGNDGWRNGGTWDDSRLFYEIEEGKVEKGILIQDSTTNILSAPDLSIFHPYEGLETEFITEPQSKTRQGMIVRNTVSNLNDAAQIRFPTISSFSGTYSFSIYIKGEGGSLGLKPRIYVGTWVNASDANKVLTSEYQLFKFENISVTTAPGINVVGLPQGASYTIHSPQLEAKEYSTSFTIDKRKESSVSYSSKLLEREAGTLNFWFKKHKEQSRIVGQGSSPKLLQVGNYYSNSSLTIWDFNNVAGVSSRLSLFIKGKTSTGWSATGAHVTNIPRGEWSMITMSWTGRVYKMYLNGEFLFEITSDEDVGEFQGGRMLIGSSGNGISGELGIGVYDEIRIDKIQRSPEEIRAWYTQERSG